MAALIPVLVGVWLSVVGAWWVLNRYAKSQDAQKLKGRVLGTSAHKQKLKPGSAALFESGQKPKGNFIPQLMERFDATTRLRTLIEQAGLKLDPVRFVHATMACFIGGYMAGFLFLSKEMRPYALLAALAGAAVPLIAVLRKRGARLHAFEEVFPDALEFISRSMRAGHAFSVALEMIHREFDDPLAAEFRRTFEEHNLGLPLDVALQSLARRIPLLDVHFFVSAVLLQKRTGGNLAEILDKLAYVIRERFKLRGRIRAISAHGKITGLALSCIPLAVGVLMFFSNPDYVTFFFTDPTGKLMLGGAIGLQALGYLAIRKIVSIEV